MIDSLYHPRQSVRTPRSDSSVSTQSRVISVLGLPMNKAITNVKTDRLVRSHRGRFLRRCPRDRGLFHDDPASDPEFLYQDRAGGVEIELTTQNHPISPTMSAESPLDNRRYKK